MNRKKIITTVLVGMLALIGVGAIVPFLFARASNCGGNSAALVNCKQILLTAQLFEATNSLFLAAVQMRSIEREQFLKLGANSWTGDARYWVRTNGLNLTSPTQIVVFCDQMFANVPQPTLWNLFRHNPAHAIGFADGTTGLMTPEAYARLDKTDFAPIANLKEIHQP